MSVGGLLVIEAERKLCNRTKPHSAGIRAPGRSACYVVAVRLGGRISVMWTQTVLVVLLIAGAFVEVGPPPHHPHDNSLEHAQAVAVQAIDPLHPHCASESPLCDQVAVLPTAGDRRLVPVPHVVGIALAGALDPIEVTSTASSVRGPPTRAPSGFGRDILLYCCIDRR